MNKATSNIIQDQIKDLTRRVKLLEWINEHPPLFKYGDTIVEVEQLEDNLTFKRTMTVKDNGKIVESNYGLFSDFTREYTCDNGEQLLQISEGNLIYLKNKHSLSYKK